jgi:hypothetical protein
MEESQPFEPGEVCIEVLSDKFSLMKIFVRLDTDGERRGKNDFAAIGDDKGNGTVVFGETVVIERPVDVLRGESRR